MGSWNVDLSRQSISLLQDLAGISQSGGSCSSTSSQAQAVTNVESAAGGHNGPVPDDMSSKKSQVENEVTKLLQMCASATNSQLALRTLAAVIRKAISGRPNERTRQIDVRSARFLETFSDCRDSADAILRLAGFRFCSQGGNTMTPPPPEQHAVAKDVMDILCQTLRNCSRAWDAAQKAFKQPTKNGTNHVDGCKSHALDFSQLRASAEAWIAEDDAIKNVGNAMVETQASQEKGALPSASSKKSTASAPSSL